jgi:hypothetical protein
MFAVETDRKESLNEPPVGVPVTVRVWTSLVGDPVRRRMSPMFAGSACDVGAA